VQRKAEGLLRGTFGVGADSLMHVLAEWPERHPPRELGAAFRQAALAHERVSQ
jgi:hypothetical protein